MKRLATIAAAALLIIAAAVWWFSPTQVVKRRTHSLLDSLSFSSSSSSAYRQAAGYGFSAHIAKSVELENEVLEIIDGTFTREMLEMGYSGLANQVKESRFEIEDFHSVIINGDIATVRATMQGFMQLPEYRPADGLYEIEFQWRKEEDSNWRLIKASWEESR